MQVSASSEQITRKSINAVAQRMEEHVEATLEKSLSKLSSMVETLVANQKDIQNSASGITSASGTLQKIMLDFDTSTKVASETSTQLTTTVNSYKDVLLVASNQNLQGGQTTSNKTSQYPRMARDLDRKQRQVLIELSKEYTESKSTEGLKEMINAAIAEITPEAPVGAKVQEITKLRNGGVVLQLLTKEATTWICDPENEATFISKLDTTARIKDRNYLLLLPRVPIFFDPNNQEHLREIECANNLPPKALSKARWIKPIYRRHPKQNFAYATFTFSSATEANRLIRDEMYICSTRMFPKRLKYEPRQCVKCRKWGHYAAECQANNNTCGTCGGEHMNRDCDEPEKRYCVSC